MHLLFPSVKYCAWSEYVNNSIMIVWWQWNIVCSFPPLTWQTSLIQQTDAKYRETWPHIHIRQKVFGYLNSKARKEKNLTGSNVIQFLGVECELYQIGSDLVKKKNRLSLECDVKFNKLFFFSGSWQFLLYPRVFEKHPPVWFQRWVPLHPPPLPTHFNKSIITYVLKWNLLPLHITPHTTICGLSWDWPWR